MSASVVILCEDGPQEYFLRHAILHQGVPKHKIRSLLCPKGKQSGEQYVREDFPNQLEKLRRYQGPAYLVVVIDADKGEVEGRKHQLTKNLNFSSDERVLFAIPKRNIETWIYFVIGHEVNEQDRYPKIKKQKLWKAKLNHLLDLAAPPADAPPSLVLLWPELARLRAFLRL